MAEQTLTINTLAATVITPSDVSQFSLDDIAPNIINGGGGTIVDVSGIVALASQVAELDSDVTVLEANVATVQADVTALQEDVSGLDATVAQVQTTATAAAETANAASGTASDALEVATQAQTTATTAETRAQLAQSTAAQAGGAATNAVKMANEAKTAATAASETAQYALNAGAAEGAETAQYALKAKVADAANLAYTVPNPDPGQTGGPYGLGTTTTRTGNIYEIQLGNTTTERVSVMYSETAQYALETEEATMASRATALQYYRTDTGWSGYLKATVNAGQLTFSDLEGNEFTVAGEAASATSLNYTNNFNQVGQLRATVTWADKSLQFNDGNGVNLVAATAAYALAVAGGSSGDDGFDGSYAGTTVELNACSGGALLLNKSGARLTGSDVAVGNPVGGNQILLAYSGIGIGDSTQTTVGSTLQLYGFGSVAIHASTAQGIADAISPFLSGGSSSGGEVSALTYKGTAYFSVTDGLPTFYADAEQIKLDARGATSLKETILMYAGSGGSSSDDYPPLTQPPGSELYYGITSPDSTYGFRFGTFENASGSPVSTLQAKDHVITVGGANVGTSQVYGFMSNNTTVGIGKVNPSKLSLGAEETGLLIDAASDMGTVLLQASNSGGGNAWLSLDATGNKATLSAMFTLVSDDISIAPTDWAKLKQLADRASDILALLSN